MLDFRFSDTSGGRNIDATATLLIQPRLWIPSGDYPAHTEWRDKALDEIKDGRKRAMVAFWGSDAIGSIVYQRHTTEKDKVEIRNISIEPYARGRHVADFLLRQVELEAAQDFPGVVSIVTDVKRTNVGILAFALQNGYQVEAVTVLVGNFASNGVEDVVLAKNLLPSEKHLDLEVV